VADSVDDATNAGFYSQNRVSLGLSKEEAKISMSGTVKPMKPKFVRSKEAEAINGQANKSVEAPRAVIVGPVMRKKELIDTVVERSGIKKKILSRSLKPCLPLWEKPWLTTVNLTYSRWASEDHQ
jgi:hypothetical protein